MQNSSFINSSFKRVVFSKLFHEQFAVYFTKQCYLALFFMQSNYHKHIQQMSCLSSVSQIQQLSTNRTTTNFQQSPEHLLPIFLPFSLHASITTISIVENQICSRCQRNFFLSIFTFTKQITMRSQWVCSPFFLPWHLSSSNSQHKIRGLPMVLMLERRKILNLLIIHQQGPDKLGRLPTRKAQNLCSQENPYPACIHFHLEDELRTTIKMRKLKNPLVKYFKQAEPHHSRIRQNNQEEIIWPRFGKKCLLSNVLTTH